jgi:hypothetical protein
VVVGTSIREPRKGEVCVVIMGLPLRAGSGIVTEEGEWEL